MLPEDLNIREYNKFDAYNNVKSSIRNGENELKVNSDGAISLPTGAATSAKQLPDNHQVTVSNQVSVEGLATHTGQDELLAEMGKKTEPTDTQLIDLLVSLKQALLLITYPPYLDRTANQIRSQVTGTVTATVASTSIVNFGSFPADHLQRMDNMTAWSTNTRSLIT